MSLRALGEVRSGNNPVTWNSQSELRPVTHQPAPEVTRHDRLVGVLESTAVQAKDNRLPGPGVDGREQAPDAHLPGDVLNPIRPGSGEFRAQSGTFAAPGHAVGG